MFNVRAKNGANMGVAAVNTGTSVRSTPRSPNPVYKCSVGADSEHDDLRVHGRSLAGDLQAPLDTVRVAGSFDLFRNVLFSNVFLLDGGPGDRWLVDTGHWSERLSLLVALRRRGLSPRDLTPGVLLTHLHSNHAGNARFLQRQGVRIHAHRRDAETPSRNRAARA